MSQDHSEKQRDNSGKTANYQRLSATIFFDAHLAYVLILFSSSLLSRGLAGKILPGAASGAKRSASLERGVHIGMRDSAREKQC
jgi:hypothetical protein